MRTSTVSEFRMLREFVHMHLVPRTRDQVLAAFTR